MPVDSIHVHVLIDSLTWGGAETLLADYVIGAQQTGIEVTVGYLEGRDQSAERLRRLGIDPTLVPIESLLRRRDRRMVRDHVAAVAPDILHTHLGYSDFEGGLAARSLGIPTVATIHVMEWEPTLREQSKARIMSFVRRHCAAKVITVSDAARKRYLGTGWDDPEHVVTVYNGIVGEARTGAGRAIRAEFGIDPESPLVAIVGVLREGKGHEIAVDAVDALRERFPGLRLLIVGDGPIRPEVEGSAAKLGEAAIMTGFRDDVLDILDAVDVLVHPSRVDALPTALIEAMAARVPVVASAVGGIPEIVVPNQTGLLVGPPATADDVAAALTELLADADLRRRFGDAGRREFEDRFTVSAWMSRLVDLYEEAIQGADGKPRARRRTRATA